MGMHEEDRIRHKNKVQQQAYDLYGSLSSEGLSDDAIATQVQELISLDPTNPRNNIYSAVLKIVGREDDYEEISDCCDGGCHNTDSE